MNVHPNLSELLRRIESLEKKIDDVSQHPIVKRYIAMRLLLDYYSEDISRTEKPWHRGD